MNTPELSVIVPFRDDEATLPPLLEALANEVWSQPWELILCDNGSTDGSRTVIESFASRIPDLQIADATEHPGASYARNVGILAATSEHIAFCDADDVIGPGWVASIGQALAREKFVASRHDATRLNPDWMVKARGATQVDGLHTLWYPPYRSHAGACGMGASRDLLIESGGFDLTFLRLQDTELSIRLQALGARLCFVPDAVIHVRYREGLMHMFQQARVWAIYNEAVYALHGNGEGIDGAWRSWFSNWKLVAHHLRRSRRRVARYRAVWQIGWNIGLLQGSLKYRVAPVSDYSRARQAH